MMKRRRRKIRLQHAFLLIACLWTIFFTYSPVDVVVLPGKDSLSVSWWRQQSRSTSIEQPPLHDDKSHGGDGKEEATRPMNLLSDQNRKSDLKQSTRLLQQARRAGEGMARSFFPSQVHSAGIEHVCSRLPRPLPRMVSHGRLTNETSIDNHQAHGYHYTQPPEGLIYMKVPKTSSSTLTGINVRIAKRWGARLAGALNNKNNSSISSSKTMTNKSQSMGTSCTHYSHHVVGAGYYYGNRNPLKSFLWGSVRDPATRAMSRVFFSLISQQGRNASDDNVALTALRTFYPPQYATVSKGRGGVQFHYLTLEEDNIRTDPMPNFYFWKPEMPGTVQTPKKLRRMVARILADYDFLAIVERLDESIVALQLILGLPPSDVLATSAKIPGKTFYYDRDRKVCVSIQQPFWSPAVQDYLKSSEWYAINHGDYLLYHAANLSLDRTIEALGQERFQRALLQYQKAQTVVRKHCQDQIFPPCSIKGVVQVELARENCYVEDSGCGYPCIDKLSEVHGW